MYHGHDHTQCAGALAAGVGRRTVEEVSKVYMGTNDSQVRQSKLASACESTKPSHVAEGRCAVRDHRTTGGLWQRWSIVVRGVIVCCAVIVTVNACGERRDADHGDLTVGLQNNVFVVVHLDTPRFEGLGFGDSMRKFEARYGTELDRRAEDAGRIAIRAKNTLPGAHVYKLGVFNRNSGGASGEFVPYAPAIRVSPRDAWNVFGFEGDDGSAKLSAFATELLIADLDMMSLDGQDQMRRDEPMKVRLLEATRALRDMYVSAYPFLSASDVGFTDMVLIAGRNDDVEVQIVLNPMENKQSITIATAGE